MASSSSAPMEVDSAAPADLDDNSSALSDLTALPDETEGEGLSPRRSFKRYGKRGPKGKFTREVNEIAPEAEAPGRVSGSAEMVAEQAANVDATGVEVVDAAADTTMDGLETPRVSRRARNDVGPAEQPMLAEGNDPGTGGRRTRGTKRNADALEEDEKAGPALPEGPYIIVGPRRGPAPPRPKVPTGKAELLPRDDRGFRIFPKVKGKAGKQRIDPVTQEAWEEMRSATHLPEGRVADGTLVWVRTLFAKPFREAYGLFRGLTSSAQAKMAGHPWFPAETSILDKNVPPAVAQMKPANAAAYVLVMFFDGDDRRTWYVPLESLHSLLAFNGSSSQAMAPSRVRAAPWREQGDGRASAERGFRGLGSKAGKGLGRLPRRSHEYGDRRRRGGRGSGRCRSCRGIVLSRQTASLT